MTPLVLSFCALGTVICLLISWDTVMANSARVSLARDKKRRECASRRNP